MHPLRRLIAYGGVNAALLPLNLTIAWLLTELGINYLIATIGGLSVHLAIAFFINRRWTFNKPELRTFAGLVRGYLVGAGAFFIVLGTTAIGVELLKWDFLWARILATVVVGMWDYLMDSIFTFKTHPLR